MSRTSIAVIGGGISGLSAGFYIKRKYGDAVRLSIYEKDSRLGGTIGTTREKGFLVDWGANGFLDREPLTLEFIEQIGLSAKLYRANEKSSKRFIYRNGRLWEISPHPIKFMTSGLLSLKGRLRIAGEYLVPAKKDDAEESIFDFAARRIGLEAAEILIDPMVSGIYGGDARALSLGACFPVMEEMEKQYGGLIKALIRKKKESKSGAGPAGPGGHLTSFRGGLYTLIEHLGEMLKDHIHLSTAPQKISRSAEGQYVFDINGSIERHDIAILAVPSYVSSQLLLEIEPEVSGRLDKIPYSNLAVVCQGIKVSDIGRNLDGFGFLVPHNQNLNILGSIWTSVIFPEQAPEGHVLFRTMLGGALNNEIIDQDDDSLADITLKELGQIVDIKSKPVLQKVFRWRKAIPQYVLGHGQLLESIDEKLEKAGNLYLAGNAYNGIGLNDSVKRSYNIVESLPRLS